MTAHVDTLALLGGTPVRTTAWPRWPERGAPERAALARVLDGEQWGGFPSPGPEAHAFSGELAAYLGTDYVVPCVNGTWSLTLALLAARVPRGSEVITTAYSFVGTAAGIVAAGCTPVFVDVCADSYCLDPDQVEAVITERTSAVMPVHLGCAMADMDRLTEICGRRGLVLIEDCAHAHGMRWRDRAAGTIGDLGSFSMQTTKLLTAGEGGVVTTRDARLEGRLQALVNCGRRETPRSESTEAVLGYNLRMTEWQAALLRAQLERLPEQHARRAQSVARISAGLGEIQGFAMPPLDPRITHRTYYQLILRYDAEALRGVPRDRVVAALEAEGVPCSGRFYVPIPDDALYAWDACTNPLVERGVAAPPAGRFPIAARAAYDESLWLPHELLLGGDRETDDLLAALAKVAAGAAQLASADLDGEE